MWSEEYQVEYLSQHFRAFDNLRKNSFWVGEMIWNFADFNTAESTPISKSLKINKDSIFVFCFLRFQFPRARGVTEKACVCATDNPKMQLIFYENVTGR
jgi:hypothetical protein